jgi:phosphoglycolate phosphatase
VLRAVIFDLDGTLIDTPAAIVQATRAATRMPHADATLIRAAIGLPLEVVLARVLGADVGSAEVVEATERYRLLWRAEVAPRLAGLVYPGVREGLQALRARGLRLGIATGKAQVGADRSVDEAGLRPLLDVVAGHDRVERPKPHPDLAILVLRELAVAPGEAVLVGDSALDIAMARGAGLRSIAVTYGAQPVAELTAAGPTWMARSFEEVVAALAA